MGLSHRGKRHGRPNITVTPKIPFDRYTMPVLLVVCPICEAGAGDRCVGVQRYHDNFGRALEAPHSERVDIARGPRVRKKKGRR